MDNFGLVFAGGGAKGAYQVGVWKAFDELNLPISAVVGASIGAINGALFALRDRELANSLYANIKMRDVVNLPDEFDGDNLFDLANARHLAAEIRRNFGLDTTPLRNLLSDAIDEDKLRTSAIDFGLITFSLTTLKPVELFKADIPRGKLVDYLLASACLPVFRNVQIDNQRFWDGGMYNNMPVSMLANKGYTNIIVVDVRGIGRIAPIDTTNLNLITIRPDEPLGGTMDLNPDVLQKNTLRGYLDARKVFGQLKGERYYFPVAEYEKLPIYGPDLEQLAQFYGIERYAEYTADAFLQKIFTIRAENRAKYNLLKTHINLVKLSKAFVGNRGVKFKAELEALRPLLLEAAIDHYATERDMRILQRMLPEEYKAVMAAKALDEVHAEEKVH